jgi:hypothetical protein
VNTIVLPCDLYWDVTGITKNDSPALPAILHDEGGFHRQTKSAGSGELSLKKAPAVGAGAKSGEGGFKNPE